MVLPFEPYQLNSSIIEIGRPTVAVAASNLYLADAIEAKDALGFCLAAVADEVERVTALFDAMGLDVTTGEDAATGSPIHQSQNFVLADGGFNLGIEFVLVEAGLRAGQGRPSVERGGERFEDARGVRFGRGLLDG